MFVRIAALPCRCWKNAFWLVTLVYPQCSTTALQMFSYTTLDIGRCAPSDPAPAAVQTDTCLPQDPSAIAISAAK